MRETVISGFHDGEAITPAHRRAILIDWVLCMTATVTVCVLFAGILISYSVESLASARLMWIGLGDRALPHRLRDPVPDLRDRRLQANEGGAGCRRGC